MCRYKRLLPRERLRSGANGPVVLSKYTNGHVLYVCASVVWCGKCAATSGGDRIVKLKNACDGRIRSSGAASRLRDLQDKRVYRTRVLGVDRKVALSGVPRRLCWGDVVKGRWKATGLLSSAGQYRVRDSRRRKRIIGNDSHAGNAGLRCASLDEGTVGLD